MDDKYAAPRVGKGKGKYDDEDGDGDSGDDYDDSHNAVTPDLGKDAFPPLDETVPTSQPTKPILQAPPYPAPPSYAHATTATNAHVSIKSESTPAPAITLADKLQKQLNEGVSNVQPNTSPQGNARPPPGLGACVRLCDYFLLNSALISQSTTGEIAEFPKRLYCVV